MSDHEPIDSLTRGIIAMLKDGPRASAPAPAASTTTAPDPGDSASSGTASATPAPASPPRAARPPSPPVPPRSSGGYGGGHGGGHGGGALLSLAKTLAIGAALVAGLLIALHYIEVVLNAGRASRDESRVRDLAIREKEIEVEAKAQTLLQPAKPVDTTLKARMFWCGSQETFNKGFAEGQVQKLDKTFSASEGCAHVVIDEQVVRIEGYNFAFDYPAPNGQFYSCGPGDVNAKNTGVESQNCVTFLNYIHTSNNPDKRVRLIVKNGGSVKIYLN